MWPYIPPQHRQLSFKAVHGFSHPSTCAIQKLRQVGFLVANEGYYSLDKNLYSVSIVQSLKKHSNTAFYIPKWTTTGTASTGELLSASSNLSRVSGICTIFISYSWIHSDHLARWDNKSFLSKVWLMAIVPTPLSLSNEKEYIIWMWF